MYSRHFDLTKDPFSIAPDPHFLFMSDRHREALAHLLFGVQGTGGFVLLTGEIGAGKTTVCRCFLEQIPPSTKVAVVFNPKVSVMELLQTICDEFQVVVGLDASTTPSLKNYIDSLNQFLLQNHAMGQNSVLIIDEAQNLSLDVLEQLRLLTNLETNERKLLQIVLIGQPELRTMLERPDMEQLAQRVIARYHLESLSELECRHYIQHRLSLAGATGKLPFDKQGMKLIYALTKGVPRRINLLCGRVLLAAWASGVHVVDRGIIRRAAKEVFGTSNTSQHGLPKAYALALLCAVLVLFAFVANPAWFKLDVDSTANSATAALPTDAAKAPRLPASAEHEVKVPTSEKVTIEKPATISMTDMEVLVPQFPTEISPTLKELDRIWMLQPGAASPCTQSIQQQQKVQCYRSSLWRLPVLTKLDRPGVLIVKNKNGQEAYVVLTHINDQAATLLVAGREYQVTLLNLARFWQGEFVTYWRPPSHFGLDLRRVDATEATAQLSKQLDVLEGLPEPSDPSAPKRAGPTLTARVKAFQASQGLDSDGYPGPMTFMLIEKLLGVNQPNVKTGEH